MPARTYEVVDGGIEYVGEDDPTDREYLPFEDVLEFAIPCRGDFPFARCHDGLARPLNCSIERLVVALMKQGYRPKLHSDSEQAAFESGNPLMRVHPAFRSSGCDLPPLAFLGA